MRAVPQSTTEALNRQQILLVLSNSVNAVLGSWAVAAFVVFSQWSSQNPSLLLLWLVWMVAVGLLRLLVSKRLQKILAAREISPLSAQRHYGVVVMFSALGWGFAAAFMVSDDVTALLFLVIALVGVVAGSVSSLTPVKSFFMTFVLISLLPLMVSLLGSSLPQAYLMAFVVGVFVLFMLRSGLTFSHATHDSILLNLQNQQLIQDLEASRQDAEAANELKGRFLANMSHEIRTPLNALLGFIPILAEGEQSPMKLKSLKVMEEAGQGLLHLISDILDFSKIEKNQVKIENLVYDPRETFQILHELFLTQAQQKNLHFSSHFYTDIPKLLKGDPMRIKQVVSNLLANAIKFTPEGKHIYWIVSYDAVAKLLRVDVVDEGIGIAPEERSRIFKPFSQADVSITRNYGGTGLGLVISSRLVELMGGVLDYESQKGQGSRFFFSLPAEAVEQPQAPRHSWKDYDFSKIKARILIVEDNATNQLLLSKLIEKTGITFDQAWDGEEAVEMVKFGHYDLILMDENMPKMNGTQAAQQIRQLEARGRIAPTQIVAVTANAMAEDRQKFLDAGMDDYLSKPIVVQSLYEVLIRCLDSKAA